MTTARPMSYYLAAMLLVLGPVLVAANWYLRPERAMAWTTAVVFLGIMALALLVASRASRSESAGSRAGDSIRGGVVFGGLILVVALGMKLATALGAIHDPDLSQRVTMALLGAFFVFTGNAMPKALRPLASMRCDAARVQSFQRVSGWTWVLTGLAYSIAWLALPIDIATPVSAVLMVGGMLVVISQIIRLRRSPKTGAAA